MDAGQQKLAIKLGDAELAEKLYNAGFRSPSAIRRASDEELEAIPGIGKATRQAIRARLPGRK